MDFAVAQHDWQVRHVRAEGLEANSGRPQASRFWNRLLAAGMKPCRLPTQSHQSGLAEEFHQSLRPQCLEEAEERAALRYHTQEDLGRPWCRIDRTTRD